MEKDIYIYFGDDLFNKLGNFCDEKISSYLPSSKIKIFNSVNFPPATQIDDVYLGWSFMVYRIGEKLYHVGFQNSATQSTEVFKDLDKNLTVTCGANEVYAFTNDGKIFYYNTQNFEDILTYISNTQQKINTLSTGDSYTMVLYSDGTVFRLNIHENTPLIPLQMKEKIIDVACGKEHVLFLSDTGQIFSYGCGSRGQLGHGTIENQEKPMLLEALDGIKMKSISCGGWHSAAISDDGDLYVWGWNESGQLGFPCAELQSISHPLSEIETLCCFPKIVEFEVEKEILSVSCGSRHTVILTEDFEVWSWGRNEYGQLGHCNDVLCDKPYKVTLPGSFVPKKIKCAFWSTLIEGTSTV